MSDGALVAFNNDNRVSLHTRGAMPTLLGRSSAGVVQASSVQNWYRRVTYSLNIPAGATEVFPVIRYAEGFTVALYSLAVGTNADGNGDAVCTAVFYLGNGVFGPALFPGSPDALEDMASTLEVFFYGILPPTNFDFGLQLVSDSPTSASFFGRISGAIAGQPVINFFPYTEVLTTEQRAVAGVIPQTVGHGITVQSAAGIFYGITKIGALKMQGGTLQLALRVSYVRKELGGTTVTVHSWQSSQYYRGDPDYTDNDVYLARFVDLSLPLSYGLPSTALDAYKRSL